MYIYMCVWGCVCVRDDPLRNYQRKMTQNSNRPLAMLQQLLLLLLLLTVAAGVPKMMVSAAHWGSFSRESKCVLPGYRKYYSRLWSINGDWGKACRSTAATVQGTYFERPDNCVDKGIGGEWGEFYVLDSGCDPHWGSFRDDGCKGDGKRQFSSVLWDVPSGKSWEGWCAQSWAEVDGVFFMQPSRCVNNILNIWGQFDVPDPCCGKGKADDSVTAPLHDQLRHRRRLLADTCMAAGGSGGIPPHDRNGLPKTPADAVDAFAADDFDADELAVFLIQASANKNGAGQASQFLVSGASSGGVQSYDVFLRSAGQPLRFFPTSSRQSQGAVRSHSIQALVVPVTSATQLTSGGTIPRGSWQAISLTSNDNAAQPARIIATSPLSGCCLSIGWDSSRRTLYMGHVQPDRGASQPYQQTGENLANHMRLQVQPFDGITLDSGRIYHIGANSERYGGYGATGLVRVNVIGLLGRNAIQIVVQFVNTTSQLVERFRDIPFF